MTPGTEEASTCTVLPFWTRSTMAGSGLPLPTAESRRAASKPAPPSAQRQRAQPVAPNGSRCCDTAP